MDTERVRDIGERAEPNVLAFPVNSRETTEGLTPTGDCYVDDDVRRRAFLSLGVVAVLFGPEAAARALSQAEAEQVTQEWSRALFVAPDRQALLPGLAADLRRLKANGGPQRAVALLSAYVAMITASGGNARVSHRWWLRAQNAADAPDDSHVAAYLAGQRAVHALYADRAPARALVLAKHALSLTAAPCAGRMHALSAVVRGSAALGRQRDAREALVALQLYAAAAWRGPAQVRLHQAAAEVDPQHAVATLAALSNAQRSDRSIRFAALRTLNVCRGRGAGVSELGEALRA